MRQLMTFMAILTAASTGLAGAHTPSKTSSSSDVTEAYRLLVADADSPTIRVIDLANGQSLATFNLNSPARLHHGASGRYVYAVQQDAGEVAIVDSGVSLEGHGDHQDIKVERPRLLPTRLTGPRPSHVGHDNERIAVFFDGDGAVQAVREQDLTRGRTKQIRRTTTGGNHHGVGQPVGRLLAVTIPPEGEGLPNAIELRDSKNVASQRLDCPRLHGEAATGRFTAFGCADGVAIYEIGRKGITARHLAYPETLPPGRMIRSMAGATGFMFIAGDFGADGMVVFDPSPADGDFRFVPLPGRRMHFHLHSEPGDKLYVIVEDGTLLNINPITGSVSAKAQVTDRYPMDPGVRRPRIASVGPYVAVSNPAAGEIVILDAETLSERRRVKLQGTPFDVLAVGGGGVTH